MPVNTAGPGVTEVMTIKVGISTASEPPPIPGWRTVTRIIVVVIIVGSKSFGMLVT